VILPSKHLPHDRALLTVGAGILVNLPEPKTISAVWQDLVENQKDQGSAMRYDNFVLALDLLFSLGAIDLRDGLLIRMKP
jgi:hypothetical protein